MNQEDNPKEVSSYLEDLSIIKNILNSKKKSFPIATWAFFSYAGLSILGTVLSIIVFPDLTRGQHLRLIWLPLFIIGITFESLAWIQKSRQTQKPLFEKGVTRLFASLFTLGPGVLYLFSSALEGGFPISSMVYFFIAGIITLMGLATGFPFITTSLAMSLMGIIFYHFHLTGTAAYLFTGFFASGVFAIQGVLIAKQEASNE